MEVFSVASEINPSNSSTLSSHLPIMPKLRANIKETPTGSPTK